MDLLPQLLMNGLALGAMYALVALGFVVIYRSSQVFNFAQGEFLVWGAMGMVALTGVGVPAPAAALLAAVLTGGLGALVERAVMRPMIGRPVFVTIILTIFVGVVLRVTASLLFGTDPVGIPTPWEATAAVELLGANVLYNALAAVITGGVVLAAFFAMLRFSRLGIEMRATASDQETALALGIDVGRVFRSAWFLAGAMAALAGIFLSMFPRSADVNLGFIALRAFPAVIVGGLDSVGGTVVAALLLGVLEVLCQGYVNESLGAFGHNFHAVFPYLAMIVVLVVRPHGLFGTREVIRV